MWPLLSFSLHAQVMTWRAEEPEGADSLPRAVSWQDGVSGAQLPGTDTCLTPTCLHHGAPHGPRPGEKEDPEAWQSISAAHSSPPVQPQGPLCQQPPTKALDLGVLLLPPLSHQPNHHGQNQAYIWESSVKRSKAPTACEEPPDLLRARPGCSTRQPSFPLCPFCNTRAVFSAQGLSCQESCCHRGAALATIEVCPLTTGGALGSSAPSQSFRDCGTGSSGA